MSQNREMFLMDHNPASVNTPTMSRTMNLLWAQISISQGNVAGTKLALCVDAQTLKTESGENRRFANTGQP
jgi:hypothetical protein